MSHERLRHMKETLMTCVENQLCNIYEVDADELGEVIDMLKDIEEAIYYSTITEAMKGNGNGNEYEFEIKNGKHHEENRMYYPRQQYVYEPPIMYEDGESSIMYQRGGNNGGRNSSSSSSSANRGSSRGESSSEGGGHSSSNYSDYMMERDEREGRSPKSRRMYMEARQNHSDKTTQLRELEKYMQELSQDMIDLIQDASAEEKQYIEKKISTLASKIGQMK